MNTGPNLLGAALWRIVLVWAVLARLALIWLQTRGHFGWLPLYYDLLLLGVGLPVFWRRRTLRAALRAWRAPGWVKFLCLGYGMVLLEEIFAALVNHLAEGFQWGLFVERVGQFWTFNLLAFTGLIGAWYVLVGVFRIRYGATEAFFLAGCWGLYAEKTIFLLAANPLVFLLLAPLNLLAYGLILTPAFWSLEFNGGRELPWPTRYALAWLLPWGMSVPAVGLLMALRERLAWAFPPRTMIP